MDSKHPFNFFKFTLITSALLCLSYSSKAQVIGSWNNGDITPRKLEAALPNAGTLSTDVNLFNGELQASEVLGSVSTPA
jgi:hypothetical protein